ncbi:MAG: hypothetical protein H0V56_02855 [Chthoniobacterales bacterium]|nr:hypothetical protein [Chthoniobacterales bacterium]
MKQNRFTKLIAVGAVSAVAFSTAFAQTTTKETSTTVGGAGVSATTTSTLDGTGVITTLTPGEFIAVRTEASVDPVRYHWTDSTTIVDIEGNTVDRALLRADLPVRYTYVQEGDRMVVSKVTVQRPLTEIKETTTTTTTTR